MSDLASRLSGVDFQVIFDTSLDAILVFRADGAILDANPVAVRRYGYTLVELRQMDVTDLAAADLKAIAPARLRQLLQSGEIFEWRHQCKDGCVLHVQVYAQAVMLHGESVLLSNVRDITARKMTEAVLQGSEQRFRNYMDHAPTIAWMKDEAGRYLYVSGAYEQRFGLKLQDCLGKTDFDLWPREIAERFRQTDRRVLDANQIFDVVESTLDANGSSKWWRNLEFPFHDASGKTHVGGIGLDITEQKASEVQIERLTRLYAALSHCNQAIVRCADDTELFPRICRDCVDYGGMQMVWVGMRDDHGRVRPVASFGAGIEYQDGLELSDRANHPAGQGPTGIAMREDRAYWCQDFESDPRTVMWHARAAAFGWHASASLPLHRRGAVIGALNLYVGVTDAFDESTMILLLKIADDISAALDRFDSAAQHRRDEEQLRVSEQHLRTIIETEPECVTVLDPDGLIVDINAAGLAVLELKAVDDARRHRFCDFMLPDYQAHFADLHRRLAQGENATLQFEIAGAHGNRRWLEIHAAPMRDARDNIVSMLGVSRDVTERKRAEDQIQYLANFDALTGLPNRVQLADRLRYALRLAKRNDGHVALMFIDLDHFKDINDTLGHSAGDTVLVEVARRLKDALRDEDTAARLGGDEFIVILAEGDEHCAARVAQKLLDAVSQPYRLDPYDLVLNASIGIALFPSDGAELESLSKNADTALYRAKREGRNCYRFFTAEMQAGAIRSMQLVNALRHALERSQLEVRYQPQRSIASNRMVGLEALLRWEAPVLGAIAPAEFIPVAEDSGLILSIGEWVLRTAIRQMKLWIMAGHRPVPVAVNLSAVQFRHPGLPDLIMRILEEEQLPATYLELELTEGVAMHDPQGAVAMMNDLHALGIRMSIDDFGTGYSSLSYLKKFNVHRLKIDRSFVQDIDTDLEDKAIVAAVISIAKSLGLKTLVEGVETTQQLAFLREQGCDEAQGYLFSEPMSATDMGALLVLENGPFGLQASGAIKNARA